jgi:uncharacterized protein involved in exopolysaccharide biosynthesis
LKEFKERHTGTLPEQQAAILRTLDRLHQEIQITAQAIRAAENQKMLIEQQIEDYQKEPSDRSPKTVLPFAPDHQPDPRTVRLEQLQAELVRLRAQFKETYPDIQLVKRQISELEAEVTGKNKPSDGEQQTSNAGQTSDVQPVRYSSGLLQSHRRLQTISSEVAALRIKQEQTISQIKEHEKRVDATFTNQQKLVGLTRDYEISQRSYERLLDKRLNAKISEDLEKARKGEQFRVVDPANLPLKPFTPNRPLIILFGTLLGGGLGGGIIFLIEYLSPSFSKPEDFQGTGNLSVLATVLRNKISRRSIASSPPCKPPTLNRRGVPHLIPRSSVESG